MNTSEKPFVWIPLKGEVERKAPVFHSAFHEKAFTGKAKFEFSVVSDYLFVGSGMLERRESLIFQPFFRSRGKICIPGTSLKGAVRSVFEALSGSCVRVRKDSERIDKVYEPCREAQNLCPACRVFGASGFREKAQNLYPACQVFGASGFRGKVSFSDAVFSGNSVNPQIVKIQALFGPREYEGRKFYRAGRASYQVGDAPEESWEFIEAIPKGARFLTTLFFENATEEELGLLFASLGLEIGKNGKLTTFQLLKIGGAKPRCFGSIRFERMGLWLLKNWKLEREGWESFVRRCLEKAWKGKTFREEVWKKLKEASESTHVPCPGGNY